MHKKEHMYKSLEQTKEKKGHPGVCHPQHRGRKRGNMKNEMEIGSSDVSSTW
jgi:hypothetical protein